MEVLIVKTNNDKLSDFEFVEPIRKILNKKNISFSEIHIRKITENFALNFDKIIITGTNLKDFSYLKYSENLSFIKKTRSEVFAICSGMHVVAKVFSVKMNNVLEIGVKHIRLNKGWVKIFLLHKKSLEYLSTKGKFFIVSKRKVKGQAVPQIIVDKNLRIFAFQFHPEVFNEDLILDFLDNKLASRLAPTFSKDNS